MIDNDYDNMDLTIALLGVAGYLFWGVCRVSLIDYPMAAPAYIFLWKLFFPVFSIIISFKIDRALKFLPVSILLSIIPNPLGLNFDIEFCELVIVFLMLSSVVKIFSANNFKVIIPSRVFSHVSSFCKSLDAISVLYILYFVSFLVISIVKFNGYFDTIGWKVRGVQLIHYFTYISFFFFICNSRDINKYYMHLLNGIFIAGLISIVLGLFSIGLSLLGHFEWTRDTVYGFFYFDRFKGTFYDPDYAGLFYVCTLSFILIFSSKRGLSRFYLKEIYSVILIFLSVLLVVSTGSRSAKLILMIPFAMGLLAKDVRPMVMQALPLCLVIYVWGFPFRSINDMIHSNNSILLDFFHDSVRAKIFNNSLSLVVNEPQVLVFGNRDLVNDNNDLTSTVPENLYLSILIQGGIFCFLIYMTSISLILWRLWLVIKSKISFCSLQAYFLCSAMLVVLTSRLFSATNFSLIWFVFIISNCFYITYLRRRVVVD